MSIIKGQLFSDDRGTLRAVNEFSFNKIKRFYQVENYNKGFIRAWHGHYLEDKYVYVAKGTARVHYVPMESISNGLSDGLITYILTDKFPSILHIPAGNANGFKTLEENTVVIFFSTLSVEESIMDDIRFPYNTIDCWNEIYR